MGKDFIWQKAQKLVKAAAIARYAAAQIDAFSMEEYWQESAIASRLRSRYISMQC